MWEGPAPCEWCHLWTGDPGCYRRAGWASCEEQGSKQPSFTAPASVPICRLLACTPFMVHYNLQYEISPFLPSSSSSLFWDRDSRLALNSLMTHDWLATKPRDPPVSAFSVLRLLTRHQTQRFYMCSKHQTWGYVFNMASTLLVEPTSQPQNFFLHCLMWNRPQRKCTKHEKIA